MSDEPLFFATPEKFRAWLSKHHASKTEQWVGFHRKATGVPSIDWSQSVDVALCFGWIDGVRYRIDEDRFKIRFTPRRPGSNWSAVNVKKVAELTRLGLMHPAGLKAFAALRADRTGIYSFEQKVDAKLPPAFEQRFKAKKRAWSWFEAQRPSYRKVAIHWVISAKQEATRERRLERLIAHCAESKMLRAFEPRK
jgi:uncharacterized protein YdeI (YjbR/CyaY-like superfamily)